MIVRRSELPDMDDLEVCRFWDLAATEKIKAGSDPDWTAGALVALAHQGDRRGEWFVLDVRRMRGTPAKVEEFLWRTHLFDDEWLQRYVPVRVEMEGGSGGAMTVHGLATGRFVGVDFKGRRPRFSKTERARPFSVAAEAGRVHLLEGGWNEEFLDEVELFPSGEHDDQVDAVVGAFHELRGGPGGAPSALERPAEDTTPGERPAPAWGAL